MNLTAWTPKSFLALRDYNGRKFGADLAAGVTVGLVALPLSMAFAIASGAPPEAGLYTAVVAGFAISALGGSRNQIGGPTGAFVVIIAGILARYGFNGLLLCTIMAGCLLILLGATGLGAAVKFIPRPVIVGFTNGIALLIASTQIKDFFGLHTGPVPGDFVGRMRVVLGNAGTVSLTTTLLSCAGLLLIVLTIRFLPRIPGYIVALVAATAAVYFLHLPVETIGSRFGGIPSGFPRFHVPVFEYATMRTLISPAITVAMLGAIESLMSAVVADRMSGDQHNPNVELMAQGVANILSPAVRRAAGDGRDCPYRDQHSLRSGVSGGRHSACADRARGAAFCCSIGAVHPAGGSGGDPDGGVLQDGRVARDPADSAALETGDRGLADDAVADRVCRSDGCGRGGHDSGGAGLHPQGHADDHGDPGDRR